MSLQMSDLKNNNKEGIKEGLLLCQKDTPEDYDDVLCGIGSCRSTALQSCANMGPFVVFVSAAVFLTQCTSSYIVSQITTLERMFGFSSSTSGLILSLNDVGYLLAVVFASYFSRRVHIPRMLCLAFAIFGICGVICCIPYFLTSYKFRLHNLLPQAENGTVISSNEAIELCLKNMTSFNASANCEKEQFGDESASLFGLTNADSARALGVISIGMILQGVAKAPRIPYVNIFIDDNTEKSKSALYMSIPNSFAVFGPAVAFGVGAVFSRMYVTLEETDMNYRDTRWIGAWWLGFLVFGSASILFSIPLAFFPKHLLPKSKRITRKEGGYGKQNHHKDFKGLLRALCRLVKNPVFVPLVLFQIINNFATSGCYAFYAKYLETQFLIPVWKADLILGGSTIFAISTATVIGGKIISKFKLSPTACMKMLTAAHTFYLLVYTSYLFLGCEQEDVTADWKAVGLDSNFRSTLSNVSCMDKCACDASLFMPVCDENMAVTYYSPCHAGCSSRNGTIYTDCSCVSSGEVSSGHCPTECSMLIPYSILMFVTAFTVSLSVMSYVVILMRCVSEEDKPTAIGVSLFSSNLCGWMPGPIVYGSIIDTACLVWNKKCSKVGSCAIYDNDDFRYKLHGGTMGIRLCAVLLVYFLLWKILKLKFFDSPSQKPSEKDELTEAAI